MSFLPSLPSALTPGFNRFNQSLLPATLALSIVGCGRSDYADVYAIHQPDLKADGSTQQDSGPVLQRDADIDAYVAPDAGVDAALDAGRDAAVFDAGFDAMPDALVDAAPDAAPDAAGDAGPAPITPPVVIKPVADFHVWGPRFDVQVEPASGQDASLIQSFEICVGYEGLDTLAADADCPATAIQRIVASGETYIVAADDQLDPVMPLRTYGLRARILATDGRSSPWGPLRTATYNSGDMSLYLPFQGDAGDGDLVEDYLGTAIGTMVTYNTDSLNPAPGAIGDAFHLDGDYLLFNQQGIQQVAFAGTEEIAFASRYRLARVPSAGTAYRMFSIADMYDRIPHFEGTFIPSQQASNPNGANFYLHNVSFYNGPATTFTAELEIAPSDIDRYHYGISVYSGSAAPYYGLIHDGALIYKQTLDYPWEHGTIDINRASLGTYVNQFGLPSASVMFRGKIDEFLVMRKAPTEEQARSHYRAAELAAGNP